MNRMLGFAFSKDGSRAVWLEGGKGELPVLVLRRLDASSTTIRSNLDRYAGQSFWFAELSDDGRLAVLGTAGGIAVVDTDSGREAAAASNDQLGVDFRTSAWLSRFAVVGDTVVGFLFASPPSAGLPLVVSTFNFRTGQVAAGPKIEGIDSVRNVRDGRALVSGRNGPLATVDGSTVHTLLPANGGVVGSATLLENGSAAAFIKRGSELRLLIWNREGQSTVDVAAPAGTSMIAGEPRTGWLALGAGADYSKPPRTVFVDSTTGAIVRAEEGLTPIGRAFDEPILPAGSPGSRILVGPRGEIVRIDPETGQREAVLVAAPPGDTR
jgi:hypothetical protein